MFLNGLKIRRSTSMLILFSVIFICELYCQDYPVRTYGVSDGLPQSIINSVRQDCRGFIWISTRNGLARFDGIETVTYFKKNGLASSHAVLTFDDWNKKLWVLTTGGLSFFNGSEFIPYPFPENIRSVYPVACTSPDSTIYFLPFCEGPYKRQVFTFKNGIYSIYSENKAFNDIGDLNGLEYDVATSSLLASDERGNLWKVDKQDYVKVTDKKVKYLFNYNNMPGFRADDRDYLYNKGFPEPVNINAGIDNDTPATFLKYRDRDYILSFISGTDSVKIVLPTEEAGYIIDGEGVLWYFSGSVLNRLIPPLFSIAYQSDLPFAGLWAVSEDRNGLLWFGSINGHLMKLSGEVFSEVTGFIKNRPGPISFYKGSRKMRDGDTWFSTDNGILIWNGSDFSWHKDIPARTQVCYIFEDSTNGTILVGTDRGLYILDNGKVILRKEFTDSDLGVIEGAAKNYWGGYWLSGHRGLVRLDGEVATQVRFPDLPEENTFTLCSDKTGGLWITSDEGLWHRNSKTGEYNAALPEEVNMPANSILAIDDNRIIVGRAADICLIYLDRFYSGRSDYFRIYNSTDGFMAGVCLDNGIIRSMDGKIWILTNNEIVRVNPDAFRINNKPPDLYITGVFYREETNKWINAEAGDLFYNNPSEVGLTRKQNNIRVTFTGISTPNPEGVRYTYRLAGYEKEWSPPVASRSVEYDNLKPGNYVFELMAVNADGIGNTDLQKIPFHIQPALWQRPLFISLTVLLSLLLTALLTWLFLRKKQKEKEESQRLRIALSRLQLKAVLGQFDPHFTFNVISSLGSLVMKGDKESAYEYITRLSSLLRSSISRDRLIIMPLAEEIELVKDYCELHKLRFRERFSYEISIDPGVDTGRLIPRMTIQSFVENAIKHGIENSITGGTLWIEIVKLSDRVEIKIRDNGIGRASAEKLNVTGTGTGLKTISQLFDYFNRFFTARCYFEIEDITEKDIPAGTLVRIVIPDICDFNIPDLSAEISGY